MKLTTFTHPTCESLRPNVWDDAALIIPGRGPLQALRGHYDDGYRAPFCEPVGAGHDVNERLSQIHVGSVSRVVSAADGARDIKGELVKDPHGGSRMLVGLLASASSLLVTGY